MKRLHGSHGAANLILAEEKDALRKRMRALRKCLAQVDPGTAAAMAASHWTGSSVGVVAGYLPQGSEIDPRPLMAALVEAGWRSLLPRAEDRSSPLSFHLSGGPLAPDAFKILAPLPTLARVTPDLVMVPVLAFDRAGGRLGQGAGCYDRTIAALRASGTVRVIGLAYAGQEVERVPTGDHDQRLDGILTDKGYLAVVQHPA